MLDRGRNKNGVLMGLDPLTAREWCALARLVVTSGGPSERRALARLLAHHDVADVVGWPAGTLDPDPAPWAEAGAPPTVEPVSAAEDVSLEAVETEDVTIEAGSGPAARDADWWEDAPAHPDQEDLSDGGFVSDGSIDHDIDHDWAAPPSFDLFGTDGDGVRWDIVGPPAALQRAAEAVGLDRNAVRVGASDDDEPEGVISHPSVFCPDPVRFLAVLAVMTKITPRASLFRVRADGDGKTTSMVRVFPDADDDVMAELDRVVPGAVDHMHDLGQAVGDALEALSHAMDEAAGDLDGQDPPETV